MNHYTLIVNVSRSESRKQHLWALCHQEISQIDLYQPLSSSTRNFNLSRWAPIKTLTLGLLAINSVQNVRFHFMSNSIQTSKSSSPRATVIHPEEIGSPTNGLITPKHFELLTRASSNVIYLQSISILLRGNSGFTAVVWISTREINNQLNIGVIRVLCGFTTQTKLSMLKSTCAKVAFDLTRRQKNR